MLNPLKSRRRPRSLAHHRKELLVALPLDRVLQRLRARGGVVRQQRRTLIYRFTLHHPFAALRWIQFSGTAQAVEGERYTLLRYGGSHLPVAFASLTVLFMALLFGVFAVFRGGFGELLTVLMIAGGVLMISVVVQAIQSLAGDSLKTLFADELVIQPEFHPLIPD